MNWLAEGRFKVMRKYVVLVIMLVSCLLGTQMASTVQGNVEDPPYAKWGRIAMQETKEKYPESFIVDYLHVGRETENGSATETFKLWLRNKNGHEFGVYVFIQFKVETEEIIKITFEETDR